jgi:hypothetical protein
MREMALSEFDSIMNNDERWAEDEEMYPGDDAKHCCCPDCECVNEVEDIGDICGNCLAGFHDGE